VYTLVTTDASGVRRERVDVRASESAFALGPAPAAPAVTGPATGSAPTAGTPPIRAVDPQTTAESAADHPGEP
jgi:hypothetical protein